MTLEVPIVITVVVLILAIAAFVSGRIPVGLVALGVTLTLFFTGVVTFEQAIAGFGCGAPRHLPRGPARGGLRAVV